MILYMGQAEIPASIMTENDPALHDDSKDGRRDDSLDIFFLNEKGQFITESLAGESERGQVLISSTFLDNFLKHRLRIRFEKNGLNAKTIKELLREKGGLFSSFWSRIVACRAFGLIGENSYSALEAIREIRNHFAHAGFKTTLSSPELVGYLSALGNFVKVLDLAAAGIPKHPEVSKYLSSVSSEEGNAYLCGIFDALPKTLAAAANPRNSPTLWQTVLEARSFRVLSEQHRVFMAAVIWLHFLIVLWPSDVRANIKSSR
jgi:hypothetical protein